MKPMPVDKERVEAVHQILQIDFGQFPEFQDIVDLAGELCHKPIALLTILDSDYNWLKARKGVDTEMMPAESSFCQYAILQEEVLVIPDTTKDERVKHNPVVCDDPRIRFYAGAPLVLSDGLKVGSLCLFDMQPGHLTALQKKILTILSRHVVFLIELELGRKELSLQIAETEAKNELLRKIAQMQSHDIRQPLTSIMGLVNLVKDGYHEVNDNWLQMLEEATNLLDMRIRTIVTESIGSRDMKVARFNRMVEEIEDYAILILDRSGNIENWNKGAEKMIGYRASEVIGKNFSIFYTKADKRNNRSAYLIEQATQNGIARDEGWRVRKDGSAFWARVVITAIHGDTGEVIGFTKVTRDLTDIKETQDSLKDRDNNARQSVHDMKKALQSIDSCLQFLEIKYRTVLDGEDRMYIDRINHSVSGIREIVDYYIRKYTW